MERKRKKKESRIRKKLVKYNVFFSEISIIICIVEIIICKIFLLT